MKFKKKSLCVNCGKKFVDSRGLSSHKKHCERKKNILKRKTYSIKQKKNLNRYAKKKNSKKVN